MLTRFVTLGLALLVAAIAMPGLAQATTVHQTKTFFDGSKLVFTVTDDGTIPESGAGKSVGDLGPFDPPEAQSGYLYPKGTPLPERPDAGGGTNTMGGVARFVNYLGVTLFTYVEVVTWNWSNYKVTSIYDQRGFNNDTCCSWQFKGNSTVNHSPPGGANFTAFAQGKYEACALIITGCSGKAPWINLTGNGNGIQTGFSYGGV